MDRITLTPEEHEAAKLQDAKIWNNGIDYFVDVNDFDPDVKTELAPGSELTVYSETTKCSVGNYFVSTQQNWINYESEE